MKQFDRGQVAIVTSVTFRALVLCQSESRRARLFPVKIQPLLTCLTPNFSGLEAFVRYASQIRLSKAVEAVSGCYVAQVMWLCECVRQRPHHGVSICLLLAFFNVKHYFLWLDIAHRMKQRWRPSKHIDPSCFWSLLSHPKLCLANTI